MVQFSFYITAASRKEQPTGDSAQAHDYHTYPVALVLLQTECLDSLMITQEECYAHLYTTKFFTQFIGTPEIDLVASGICKQAHKYRWKTDPGSMAVEKTRQLAGQLNPFAGHKC